MRVSGARSPSTIRSYGTRPRSSTMMSVPPTTNASELAPPNRINLANIAWRRSAGDSRASSWFVLAVALMVAPRRGRERGGRPVRTERAYGPRSPLPLSRRLELRRNFHAGEVLQDDLLV